MLLLLLLFDNDLFGKHYGTLCYGKKFWNFMELYNGYDGTEQLQLKRFSKAGSHPRSLKPLLSASMWLTA